MKNLNIRTVNYHLWKACNMRCKFCYATFQDIPTTALPKGHLAKEASMSVIRDLRNHGFEKINFAGGEPTLCPWLPDLVIYASSIGFQTSIISNGWRICKEADYLDAFKGKLDIVGISIDSVSDEKNILAGRAHGGRYCLKESDYQEIALQVKQRDIYLKINTVVSRINYQECITPFINLVQPNRWKVLQMLNVDGQNDHHSAQFEISSEEFEAYVDKSRIDLDSFVQLVPESNVLITGSYVMVNPAGCFFDDTKGRHTNSRPILDVGVATAFHEVNSDPEKFFKRGGAYSLK